MIESTPIPPVDDGDQLARFIVNSNEFRNSDSTVKPKLFMPYSRVELSVNRHRECTEQELWQVGLDVARTRKCGLYGRADFVASACRIDTLDVVARPLLGNSNHADIIGFPEKKEDQQSIAIKLAASASRRFPVPDSASTSDTIESSK